MPQKIIRAVAFDLGGTLEDIYYDPDMRLAATPGLQQLLAERGLDPGLPVDELYKVVIAGIKAYGAWRERTEQELPPERVWADFVFPGRGLPPDVLERNAEEISFYYETHYHRRVMRPETPALLAGLAARGLRLGMISNIISRTVVPARLADCGIDRYFDAVLTSSGFGWRKPNERIFLEAARQLGVEPAECAYVGDTISRDVAGSQRAGYGLSIQIKSFLTTVSDKESDVQVPDAVVTDLSEVLDLVSEGARQLSM